MAFGACGVGSDGNAYCWKQGTGTVGASVEDAVEMLGDGVVRLGNGSIVGIDTSTEDDDILAEALTLGADAAERGGHSLLTLLNGNVTDRSARGNHEAASGEIAVSGDVVALIDGEQCARLENDEIGAGTLVSTRPIALRSPFF